MKRESFDLLKSNESMTCYEDCLNDVTEIRFEYGISGILRYHL